MSSSNAAIRRLAMSESYFSGFGNPPGVGTQDGWYKQTPFVATEGVCSRCKSACGQRQHDGY